MDSRGHLCGSDWLRILSKEPLAQLLETRELLRRERLGGFTRQLQVGTESEALRYIRAGNCRRFPYGMGTSAITQIPEQLAARR